MSICKQLEYKSIFNVPHVALGEVLTDALYKALVTKNTVSQIQKVSKTRKSMTIFIWSIKSKMVPVIIGVPTPRLEE